MKPCYLKAIFLEEANSRFICKILKDEENIECYISSSSKLSNYLTLENCDVLISKNKGRKLRTEYTLEAVEFKKILYYVNFNKVNELYYNLLLSSGFEAKTIHREYLVNNQIKTDFCFQNQGKWVCAEIKALLCSSNKVIFPDNSSHRTERQLLQYIELLRENIDVTFCFIAMSATITDFELNLSKKRIKVCLAEAVSLGMKISAYSVIYNCGDFELTENRTLEENILKAILS